MTYKQFIHILNVKLIFENIKIYKASSLSTYPQCIQQLLHNYIIICNNKKEE